MLKITGLDKLNRHVEGFKKALTELEDGALGQVKFDPEDPASIQAAIQLAHDLIDEKLGDFADNPFVAPLIEGAKEQMRAGILQQAAKARVKGDDTE